MSSKDWDNKIEDCYYCIKNHVIKSSDNREEQKEFVLQMKEQLEFLYRNFDTEIPDITIHRNI